jgi:uncharacterized protein (DUF1330 family)
MVDFINTKTGTLRRPDGGLQSSAGRVQSLDEVIRAAEFAVSEALVTSLATAAEALAGTKDAARAADYVSTAKKVVAKGGASYVAKELKRLDGMIASKNIVPEKKTTFQMRRNLLAAFDQDSA